jgi:ribosomal protein S18 acetylase RimI-like enzyme
MAIIYRNATREDCSAVAELVNDASGGLVDFLFHNLVPGKTPVEFLTDSLRTDRSHYSFRNAEIAEIDGEIAGMSVSFEAEKHRITKEMRHFFPPDRLEHLYEMYNSRVPGSLYIDALAVRQQYRRSGVASGLLSRAEHKAMKAGKGSTSLIALADNHPALKLYEKSGFKRVKHIAIEHHKLIPHHGGAYLMRRELAP